MAAFSWKPHTLWHRLWGGKRGVRLHRAAVVVALVLGLTGQPSTARAQANLIANPTFAAVNAGQPDAWDFWTRTPDGGSINLDTPAPGVAGRSARIDHHTSDDWNFASHSPIAVQPGEIYDLSGWAKAQNAQDAEIGVVTRDPQGQTLDWDYGAISVSGADGWQHFTRKLVVPPGCASIQYRLIGSGTETVWLDGASLVRTGNIATLQAQLAGKFLTLDNPALHVRLDEQHGLLSVTDKRIGRTWSQQAAGNDQIVTSAHRQGSALILTIWDVPDDLHYAVTFALARAAPEVDATLDGTGALGAPLAFPQPFVTGEGTWLVVPLDEGILYPVDDPTIEPMTLLAYQGHGGLSMPWYGTADVKSGAGFLTLLETCDDARAQIARGSQTGLYIAPAWDPSRGQFRYPRKLAYVFFDKGGYVAQAKWYRHYAQETGLFKTLAEKRKANPNVDRLVGAVNVWNWDIDKQDLSRQLKSLGMDYVLCSNCDLGWSNTPAAQGMAAINKLGFLTSRYDIYQDVYPPDAPSWLPHDGWPKDLDLLPNGDWMKGWADIEHQPNGKDIVYQGGVLCSSAILDLAKKEIPPDLAAHPYTCRFLDTTTASPWRECYDPSHPLTRSQDRANKMALLNYVSGQEKLVLGSETGIDAAVPYADYFEGMMSLAPYRLPDSGRDLLVYKPPTPDFLKFQIGSYYRVPLWELVYHECMVDYWYWGDASNKAPEVWDQRDLFNILYATPPMFVFDKYMWNTEQARFVQSYKNVCPLARRLGYDEMLSHSFLTADHTVQMTRWKSGVEIVVNFGDKPYHLANGQIVAPKRWLIRSTK